MTDSLAALIADAKKTPRSQAVDAFVDSPRMLDTVDEFISVAAAAINDLAMESTYLSDCRQRGCRTHLEVWRPQAIGYVGNVSNGRWYAIVQTQIRQMISDLQIRQYNGDWRLARADFSTFFMDVVETTTTNADSKQLTGDYKKEFQTTARRLKTRFFLLACEFIDAKGTAPARYSQADGMPIDDNPVSISPDVQALLAMARAANTPSQQEVEAQAAEDERVAELAAENERLSSEMSQVRQMLEQLLSAQPAPAPAAKKPRRSRRKPAAKSVDDTLQALEGDGD